MILCMRTTRKRTRSSSGIICNPRTAGSFGSTVVSCQWTPQATVNKPQCSSRGQFKYLYTFSPHGQRQNTKILRNDLDSECFLWPCEAAHFWLIPPFRPGYLGRSVKPRCSARKGLRHQIWPSRVQLPPLSVNWSPLRKARQLMLSCVTWSMSSSSLSFPTANWGAEYMCKLSEGKNLDFLEFEIRDGKSNAQFYRVRKHTLR